jgi:hypothetical protein
MQRVPQFSPNFRLNPNSTTSNDKEKEAVLESRVVSVLKAMERDHSVQFTSAKGTNKDKWPGFQQKMKNLSAGSNDFRNDPRVAYLKYVGDRTISLQKRLNAHVPTAEEIASLEPWNSPNNMANQILKNVTPPVNNDPRPTSPAGSVVSAGSNVAKMSNFEHGGRRTRHKRRSGSKRRHHTGKRKHR